MIRQALYRSFSLIAESKIRQLESESHKPQEAQLAKLRRIIQANINSEFGREHGFGSIRTVEDFQSAVPVRDYEGFRPYVDRLAGGAKAILTADDPLMFATTSGTTGQPKYIPITSGYMKEFRLASVVSGYHLLRTFPKIAHGVALSVASPAEEGRTAGGIPYGAISGQLFRHEPFLIKRFISPIPYEVFLIPDYETRYYTLLRLALTLPVSCFYTLNPSTVSLLCRRLKQYALPLIDDLRTGGATPPGVLPVEAAGAIRKFLHPNRARADYLQALLSSGEFAPHKIWPTLAVVSCWTKAAAAFYLSEFPSLFGSVPVCDITYGASEGRGTVFMGPDKQMLALQSHFFEFIPVSEMGKDSPTILLAEQLEVEECYFILFTTSAGLYRYNINDVVKVTGFYNRTPILEFQYKGGNICSFTGEKITELQVTAAMTRTAEAMNLRFRFFSVIPQVKPEPHYQLWLEPDFGFEVSDCRSELMLARLSAIFDQEMAIENIEYKTKRESHRLSPVQARLLLPGSYETLRLKLTAAGVADAQIKVSHLNPKEQLRAFLEQNLTDKGASKLDYIGCVS